MSEQWVVQYWDDTSDVWWTVPRSLHKKKRGAEDEMSFLLGRSPHRRFRVIERGRAEAAENAYRKASLARSAANKVSADRPKPKRFQDVKIQAPSGLSRDAWEAWLEANHPEVWAAIERVCDGAGTSDADANILYAAGQIIADLHAFGTDAVDAMKNRNALKFDALARRFASIYST